MATKISDLSACTNCGHSEAEHARLGTRPCLAVVGELAEREFCPCGEFHIRLALAA